MADLGLDPKVLALRNARTPAEWVAALYDLAISAFGKDATTLGDAALLNTDSIFPTGAMISWAGGAVPSGFLLCDGSLASKALYPDLAAKLKTTWGAETATHFRLPDSRRRVAVCLGSADETPGSNAPDSEIGSTGGAEQHALTAEQMPRHRHGAGTLRGAAAGGHSHGQTGGTARRERINFNSGTGRGTGFGYTRTSGRHKHPVSGETANAGAASPAAFSLFSSCIVVDRIIRT